MVGATVDNKGSILLYREQGNQYKFVSILYQDAGVSLIEMPNFIALSDYLYLLVYSAKEKVYTVVGDFVRTSYYFNAFSQKKLFDFGKHLYATAVFKPDRKIIAFSNLLGNSNEGYQGVITIPRTISVDAKYNVFVNPYYTISNLYVSDTPVVSWNAPFPGDAIYKVPDLLDVLITIPPESINLDWSFGFNVHQDDPKKGLYVIYNSTQANVQIVDAQTKTTQTLVSGIISKKEVDGVTLRILVDRAAIEVFVNAGEQAGAYRFTEYPLYQYFYVVCTKTATRPVVSYRIYEIGSIW